MATVLTPATIWAEGFTCRPIALKKQLIELTFQKASTRVMSSLLFGVSPTALAAFAFVPLILAKVARLACYITAKRATRGDPLVALRFE